MSGRDTERRRDAIRRLARELGTQDVHRLADQAGRRGLLRGIAFGTVRLRELEVAQAISEARTAELLPRDEVRR